MGAGRVIFVTGKGGVGKTTVAAALGLACAHAGARTLLIETAADGSLAQLFGLSRFPAAPRSIRDNLQGLSVEPERLVRDYFSRLLKLPFLTERLLQSASFRALTDAAPGIAEFLLLEHISSCVDASFWHRRQRFDLVVVDGPASGHMRKLLKVPRQMLNLVVGGPLRRTALHLEALLTDPSRCLVVPVSLAEELAVEETLETWAVLRQELFLPVARPVVNRVFPRRFSRAESNELRRWENGGPVVQAARYAISMREEAERHTRALRQGTGKVPLVLSEHFAGVFSLGDLLRYGRRLRKHLLAEAGWVRATERKTDHAATS
ncbi:MAG: hypothetical protein KatS3mg077_2811 [Candidatus Binatia bacterium]|nr:MAG: hypothetical protein KatS3mg077_2811 [Candidatus Binatia bacterium]